jgi:uncharacterized OB-fold protein
MVNGKDGSEGKKKVVPIAKGLFKLPNKEFPEGYLIGGKCKKCGLVFFPKAFVCFNCRVMDSIEEISLNSRGKLWSFSKSMYPLRRLIDRSYTVRSLAMDRTDPIVI